jgi:tetratricopeptide (TPR) repeat protein
MGTYGYLWWVMSPLVPAFLFFLILPKNKIWSEGPLKDLTTRATGASVAYFVVFAVLAYPAIQMIAGATPNPIAGATTSRDATQKKDCAAPPEPTSVDALMERASNCTAIGDYSNAIMEYSKALDLDPKNPRILNNRGVVYETSTDYERALKDYNTAIDLSPNYALAFSNRCSVQYKKDEYQSAIKDCDRAVQLDPASANAYILRAKVFRGLEKLDDALNDYEQAIRLNPSSIPALFGQARAYEAMHRPDDALKSYGRIIQLDPTMALAWNNRCWVRAINSSAKPDLELALSDCHKAVQLAPGDPSILDSRGLVFLKLCRFDESMKDYDLAIRVRPGEASSLYGRGIAKLKTGNEKGGHEDLEKAKVIDNDVAKEFDSYGGDQCPLS